MPNIQNSLEGVISSVIKNVQLTAQNKGIPPKETLLFYDVVLPDSIPNSWDAVDLISHCEYLVEEEE